MYHNEHEVGQAVAAFLAGEANTPDLTREHIWFTTKLASNTSYDATRRAIRQSIQTSGLGYIDLYLLHSPYGGKAARLDCWRAVQDAITAGEVRSGGVSNYGVKHVCKESTFLPFFFLFPLPFSCIQYNGVTASIIGFIFFSSHPLKTHKMSRRADRASVSFASSSLPSR